MLIYTCIGFNLLQIDWSLCLWSHTVDETLLCNFLGHKSWPRKLLRSVSSTVVRSYHWIKGSIQISRSYDDTPVSQLITSVQQTYQHHGLYRLVDSMRVCLNSQFKRALLLHNIHTELELIILRYNQTKPYDPDDSKRFESAVMLITSHLICDTCI